MTPLDPEESAHSGVLADPEWKALAWGLAAAIALLAAGLLIGLVQGNLLPGACEGLACLFTGLILGYAGIITAVWFVVGVAVVLARRRWPTSNWRLWALRVLAALSWIPLGGLLAISLDG